MATVNLQKYRQLNHQLEDAEERADQAENGLSKMRAKNRSTASLAPGHSLSVSSQFQKAEQHTLQQSRSMMFD